MKIAIPRERKTLEGRHAGRLAAAPELPGDQRLGIRGEVEGQVGIAQFGYAGGGLRAVGEARRQDVAVSERRKVGVGEAEPPRIGLAEAIG